MSSDSGAAFVIGLLLALALVLGATEASLVAHSIHSVLLALRGQ